jgi:hypothetical protein
MIYGRDKTIATHRKGIRKLAEITKRVVEENRLFLMGRDRQTWLNEMNHAFIADLLIWNCLTAKAIKYEDERGTRLILRHQQPVFRVSGWPLGRSRTCNLRICKPRADTPHRAA